MTAPKSGMSVSCPCGASLDIDPNETTQEIACPECGMTLEVAVAIDSRTKKVRLGILVKDQSLSQRTPRGKGQETHTAKCVCGALITVDVDYARVRQHMYDQAIALLRGTSVTTLPIASPDSFSIAVNVAAAKRLRSPVDKRLFYRATELYYE